MKKKSPFVTFILFILLAVSVGVFSYAGYMLLGFYREYKAGSDEYDSIKNEFFVEDDGDSEAPEDGSSEKEERPESGQDYAYAEGTEPGELDAATLQDLTDQVRLADGRETLLV